MEEKNSICSSQTMTWANMKELGQIFFLSKSVHLLPKLISMVDITKIEELTTKTVYFHKIRKCQCPKSGTILLKVVVLQIVISLERSLNTKVVNKT